MAREQSAGDTEPEAVTEIVSNGGRNADGSARMLERWTFEYVPARRLVEKNLRGRVLNACAGKTTLNHDGEIIRNDLNPDRDADTHHDVATIAQHFGPQSFDTIVFDPPFDEKQAETKYDGLHASDMYAALGQFNELVRPGGVVLTFGWNSWGMRSFPAFEREETVLLQRGPIHRDVIVTVDRRTSASLANDEFVRASELRSDGGAPQARPEGYWDGLAENAPSADACDVCGADGESDAHDVRRVRTPQHDARVALCRSCRSLWGEDE
ncbi:hypothetical protein [Halocalculus aciditolerans]|uniref:Uncharacterized protein n=1 Tax=Halocalculus aciditolerans TaxID=1383812 RepID=A0A830FR91_9EURY|nr:hypothetical protein [Halocalculus aciditolerans]GGL73685.1 hypothetical protein GCM10009039_34730 [Halocalculus aciditolerans]